MTKNGIEIQRHLTESLIKFYYQNKTGIFSEKKPNEM